MNESQKKKMMSDIAVGIVAVAVWYFFALAINEVFLIVASLLFSEISTALFVFVQILAIIVAYQTILSIKLDILKLLHKKKTLMRFVFFGGTIGIIFLATISSILTNF